MDTSQAPEIYVAKIPSGGIPAAEHVGTAGGPPTSLSGAECQVYYLSTDDGILNPIDGNTRWVYNLSTNDITGTGWVLIVREKGGDWVAVNVVRSAYGDEAGAGQCQFAKLNTDDCVKISYLNSETGEVEEYYLRFDGTSNSWKSAENFLYPGGSGTFEFEYSLGQFHLYLGGNHLINCGDGCFTGSWITGHGTNESGTGTPESEPCNATAFTVCVSCSCCPITGWDGEGWYCVTDDSTGTGTGTGTGPGECEVMYLLDEDKCDTEITICSGPYDTEAGALSECLGPATPGSACDTGGVFELGQTLSGTGPSDKFFHRAQGPGSLKLNVTSSGSSPLEIVITSWPNADCTGSPTIILDVSPATGVPTCYNVTVPSGAQCICIRFFWSFFVSGSFTATLTSGSCP